MTAPTGEYGRATHESEHLFRGDDEAWDAYQEYLFDHDAYVAEGGILVADDFVTWLNWNPIGMAHRDRILATLSDSSAQPLS